MFRAYLPKALALTLLTAGLTMAGAQQAQPDQAPTPDAPHARHHHAPNPQKQAERLGKRLNLTPDQTAKLQPILADRDQKLQAVFQNQQLTQENRHEQMRAIHEQTEQQLSSVLTPDQLNQLKSMRHRGGRHHGENPEAGQAPSA
jgi:transposase